MAVSQKEGARHALYISSGKTDKITFEPGEQHAVDAFSVEILAQFGVGQSKRVVEFAAGIGETRKVVEMIRREKFSGAVFGPEMDEGKTCAFGFELRAKFGELGDRLAAKSSAKVAQEDKQERMIGRERVDGFTGLRTVGLQ